ncbi:MAG: arginine--tRNA ligase [Candidatus Micrarchaeota archaeon]|nr:arginine--tRNA ligase [Candidatus Micrarchaeota archaeon]
METVNSLKHEIAENLFDALAKLKYEVTREECLNSIIPAKPEFGDLSTNIAFLLAKKRAKNPAEVAQEISKKLKCSKKLIKEVRVAGPYINFIFSDSFVFSVFSDVLDKKEVYGKWENKGKKAIIEYPSVNPNKPWHIGHLRNALLGNSISNILEFNGYSVERENFINDLGLQVAQSIWGYLTLPRSAEDEKEKFDLLIGKQYVEISKDPSKIETEVRRLMKKLDERDPVSSKTARNICERVVKAQLQTSFNYEIYEDVLLWESDLIGFKLYDSIFSKMLKSGIFVKETEGEKKGCIVVKLDEKEFPSLKSDEKVIVRSDGVPTYTAKDIALAMWKFGLAEGNLKFSVFEKQPNKKSLYSTDMNGRDVKGFGKGDIVVNVIGVEQTYLQDLIRYVIRKMGYEEQANNYIHVAYEHVTLPEAAFSGREGTWLGYSADDLFAEGMKRALEEIGKRVDKSGIQEKEKEKIARQIVNAAIKFSFLRVSPNKKVTFEWGRALSFEGDSGPYLQYAGVRAKKILEKSETKPSIKISSAKSYQLNESERQLAKTILEFETIVEKAALTYQPNLIAEYSLRLADAFNRFYESTPVLKSSEEEQKIRLAITQAALYVLSSSLALLGISIPDKM